MKRHELKSLIKEVVKHCIREGGPQYKVRNGRSYVEQPGMVNRARQIQDDPEINEDASLDGVGTGMDHPYDEEKEVRLIKQVAVGILKLLQMHADDEGEPEAKEPAAPPAFPPKEKSPKKSENPAPEDDEDEKKEVDEGGAQYKVRDGRSYVERPGKVNRARQIQDEPEVNESGHKVQTGTSARTVQNLPNNPQNVRDPKLP